MTWLRLVVSSSQWGAEVPIAGGVFVSGFVLKVHSSDTLSQVILDYICKKESMILLCHEVLACVHAVLEGGGISPSSAPCMVCGIPIVFR